jgi:hypothetical protein
MATGENKAGLALALLMLPRLVIPSPLLLLIHHLLPPPPPLVKTTLLCDGLRPRDGEEGLPLAAAGW